LSGKRDAAVRTRTPDERPRAVTDVLTTPAAELIGVSRVYSGGVVALSDVTFSIARGDFVAIVGPSGSGKSTLLNLLGTLDAPTGGTVRIDGHDVGALDDRRTAELRARTIGFVFQRFHLAQGVSALDNVADGLLYAGVPLRERRRRPERMAPRHGVRGSARPAPGGWSGPVRSGGSRTRGAARRDAHLAERDRRGPTAGSGGAVGPARLPGQ
jgi:putative ABC transport system ATP-binding protein